MESDLGVTTSPSPVTNRKLAPPVSSTKGSGSGIQEHVLIITGRMGGYGGVQAHGVV